MKFIMPLMSYGYMLMSEMKNPRWCEGCLGDEIQNFRSHLASLWIHSQRDRWVWKTKILSRFIALWCIFIKRIPPSQKLHQRKFMLNFYSLKNLLTSPLEIKINLFEGEKMGLYFHLFAFKYLSYRIFLWLFIIIFHDWLTIFMRKTK